MTHDLRTLLSIAVLAASCDARNPDLGDDGDTARDTAGTDTSLADVTCQRAQDCASDEVCLSDGTCADPYGHTWSVGLGLGRIHPTKPSDAAWDPLGGAPDPFWTLFVDGAEIGGGAIHENSTSVDWTERYQVVIDDDTTIRFLVEDDDLNFDDEIAELVYSPPSIQALRDEGAGIEVDDSDFGVVFELVD